MATYNVSVTTVLLVEAPTEADARTGAERYLADIPGVGVMPGKTDAFESEPLDHQADLVVRTTGHPGGPALSRA